MKQKRHGELEPDRKHKKKRKNVGIDVTDGQKMTMKGDKAKDMKGKNIVERKDRTLEDRPQLSRDQKIAAANEWADGYRSEEEESNISSQEETPAPDAVFAPAKQIPDELKFQTLYLTRLTSAFGDELEKVRHEDGFDAAGLEMLIDSLRAGVSVYEEGGREVGG